jgi:hypothetical protein
MAGSHMFLILSHLNKFRFGRATATAQCWLESDRHYFNRFSGSWIVSARSGFRQCFMQVET